MAKKSTTPRGKRTSKSHPIEQKTEDLRQDVNDKEAERGAPVEHYHVEPDRGERTGSRGSVEEETLDRSAPYNKTYGK